MEEKIITNEDATDWISELPECIIENILLRLDKPKERVRVSVLSKKWFALTASLPVLEFRFHDFGDEDDWISNHDVREDFYKYVKHTVSRFCRQQNLKIAHTFKLFIMVMDNTELEIVEKCLELILLRGLEVLEICIKKSMKCKWQPMYRLPHILSSVSRLTSLKISQCDMLPSSLMVGVVNFKSLKKLWLNGVPLNPLVIKHLTASCPLLEVLVVERCHGIKKFFVCGQLQNLKTLRFIDYSANGIETIDIEAPNLCECFLVVGQEMCPTSVIMSSCKQLRTLYLNGPFFRTPIGVSEFLSNFPSLETMSLRLVNQCNILKVSSPTLRKFVLYGNCDLEKIDISTPNLVIFSYSNVWNYSDSGVHFIKSNSGELEPHMECDITDNFDTLWLLKLRRYLEKEKKIQVSEA